MKKFKSGLKVVAGAAVVGCAASANAASNITQVLTEVDGYVTTGIGIGVLVLLFVLGRKVTRKTAG